jgi:hypothetical protein
VGRLRAELDATTARQLAETLPPPIFNADRRLMELDRMER